MSCYRHEPPRRPTSEVDLIARACSGVSKPRGITVTVRPSERVHRGRVVRDHPWRTTCGAGMPITAGHSGILATIYAGSTNRMELIDARAIDDDVILASARSTLDAPHGPLQGVHSATSTSVMIRSGNDWSVAATQNTLVALG